MLSYFVDKSVMTTEYILACYELNVMLVQCPVYRSKPVVLGMEVGDCESF